jgi:hypothetical protein
MLKQVNNSVPLQNIALAARLPEAPPDFVLTPDALMNYCATRLRDLDNQINYEMTKQQTVQKENSTLTNLLQQLSGDIGGDVDLTNGAGNQCVLTAIGHLESAAESLKTTDPQTAQKLTDLAAKLHELGDAKNQGSNGTNFQHALPLATFKAAISDSVSNMQKDLNSGTELAMINLQSLMSQRQSAVQTVTNMVQSLGDQMNKITSNIGH